MDKHITMLKVFIGVMSGNKKQTELILPNMYFESIFEIDYDYLKAKNKLNIIFDIDNTIMPVDDINVTSKLKQFIKGLKENGFNICLVSNSTKERVMPVSKELEVNALYNAKKPLPTCFDKAIEKLNSSKDKTVMVGDQMLSDIKGANEYGLYTILVNPISKKQNIQTGTSKFLQNIMIKKLSKNNRFILNNFYKRSENDDAT